MGGVLNATPDQSRNHIPKNIATIISILKLCEVSRDMFLANRMISSPQLGFKIAQGFIDRLKGYKLYGIGTGAGS